MTQIFATITTSLDGYVTGPNDGPAQGLGEGGERLERCTVGPRGIPGDRGWALRDEKAGEIRGAKGQVTLVHADGGVQARRVAVVGLGKAAGPAEARGAESLW